LAFRPGRSVLLSVREIAEKEGSSMTVLLSVLFAAGTVALVVVLSGARDPGQAAAEPDGWGVPGRGARFRPGRWAEEDRPHHHSEPVLVAVPCCLYCGSYGHSTFLHASR
jgi:hypothetical protein